MSMSRLDIHSEAAAKAMVAGLTNMVRENIRAHLMAATEKIVNDAVDGAMESFKMSIQTARDSVAAMDLVKVIVEHKGK